jgi:nicotinamidase-related amidase
MPVVLVRVAFRPGYPEIAESNLSFSVVKNRGDGAMTLDAPATQIIERLTPRDDEFVIVKKRISAFAGSDLEVLLRGLGVDSLVLGGISTSGVVLSTVRLAADLDFRLTVLTDACADPDKEVHCVLTEKVFPRQALVTSVDDWVGSL